MPTLPRLLTVLALALAGCSTNTTLVTPTFTACEAGPALGARRVRVASYNIKSGLETSFDEVAGVLAGIDADVVALQEVDVGVDRTARKDQAAELATRLGMRSIFAATVDRGGGLYGVALLSKFPIAEASRVELRSFGAFEPRVAIDATVCVGRRPVHVVATHTDFLTPGRNIDLLLAHVKPLVGHGLLVAGDFNIEPHAEPPARLVKAGTADLLASVKRGTFGRGTARLDYLFADPVLGERVAGVDVGTVHASDHLPIWADFDLPREWDDG